MSNVPQTAARQRTFLKGTLYFDNRTGSVDCVIREISETGARLTLQHPTVVPELVELFIPHKQQTFRARVQSRELYEICVGFELDRVQEPRRAVDIELQQRVTAMESEIAALKRLVGKLKAKILPHDLDVG